MTPRGELAGYTLLGEVGRGGTGVVYRARSRDGRDVALKLLARTKGLDVDRFRREKRLLELLGAEAGFVPLLDAGEGPEGPFVVMPFLGGGTLRDRLDRAGRLPQEECVALGRALAAALGRAHEKGVVHRDLKPENVIFTDDGKPLVADLGIAKHFTDTTPGASASVSLSRTGELRGTVGYAPAEQMADAKSAGPPADVFALGAILYECLTGAPAFHGQTVLEVLSRIEQGAFAPVRKRAPDVAPWLASLVQRALARDPAARLQDGSALAAIAAVAAWQWPARSMPRPMPPAPEVAPPGSKDAPAVSTPPADSPLDPRTLDLCAGFRDSKRTRLRALLGRYDWKHADSVCAVAVSADGKRIATGGEDAVIHLWDPATGREVGALTGHRGSVLALAFLPDGRLASGGWDGIVRLWDLEKGGEPTVLTTHKHPVRGIAVSPQGQRVASVAENGNVHVWDQETILHALPHQKSDMLACAFSPDGRSLLTGSASSGASIWDLATSERRERYDGTKAPVRAVAFTEDGRRMILGFEDGKVSGIDLAGGPGRHFAFGAPVRALVSTEGLRAFVGLANGQIALVDLARGSITDLVAHHAEEVSALAYSAKGHFLVSGSSDGTAAVWDETGSKPLSRLVGHPSRVRSIDWVAGGERLLTASERDSKIRLWDPKTGRELASADQGGEVFAVAAAGKTAAVAGGSFGLRFWDVSRAELRELGGISLERTGPVHALAVSKDGERILTGARGGKLRLWDIARGAPLREFDDSEGVSAVGLAPDDGYALAAHDDGRIALWLLVGGTGVILESPGAAVLACHYVRSRRILAAYRDGQARLWDPGTFELKKTYGKHDSWCYDADANPDLSVVITAGRDGAILIEDADSGELLDRIDLASSSDFARSIRFSPDGKAFAVGTARGVVLVFEMR